MFDFDTTGEKVRIYRDFCITLRKEKSRKIENESIMFDFDTTGEKVRIYRDFCITLRKEMSRNSSFIREIPDLTIISNSDILAHL